MRPRSTHQEPAASGLRLHPDGGGRRRRDWFDGKLIRKDGLFLPDSLKGLNP
jgi:hypothetical protein